MNGLKITIRKRKEHYIVRGFLDDSLVIMAEGDEVNINPEEKVSEKFSVEIYNGSNLTSIYCNEVIEQ